MDDTSPPNLPTKGDDPKPKKRKAVCMPPPHEAVEEAEARAQRILKKTRPKKPVTTKEKIAAAQAGGRKSAEKKTEAEMQRQMMAQSVAARKLQQQSFGLTALLGLHRTTSRGSGFSSAEATKGKKKEDGVLFRPTQRAKRMKGILLQQLQQQQQTSAPTPAANGIILNSGLAAKKTTGLPPAGEKVFPLMKLKPSIRARIWELCVVDSEFFVWPDSKTGREQPDLAMTCKQIREEVLPIYYGHNSFAIDVTPPGKGDEPDFATMGINAFLQVFEPWAVVIEEGGWFRHIRKWVCSYRPTRPAGVATKAEPSDAFISIHYDSLELEKKSTDLKEESSDGEEEPLDFQKSSLGLKKKSRYWRAEAIEIHRDARCLLSGHKGFEICAVKNQPDWLAEAVIRMFEDARDRDVSPSMVSELCMEIIEHVPGLVESRCEALMQSLETERPVVEVE